MFQLFRRQTPQQQQIAEIAKREKIQQQAIEELNRYLPDTVRVEPVSIKSKICRSVDRYSAKKRLPVTFCWGILYSEFCDRFRVNLEACGRNHVPRLSGIEFAEQYGQIHRLYSLSKEIFAQQERKS